MADDPSFNNKEKNRWLNPGQLLTIEGKNLTGVSSLVFTPIIEEETLLSDEPTEVSCVANEDGNSVTVTLAEDMAEGSYRVSAVNDSGEHFGLGLVTVSNEAYVEGDVVEVALWEGNQAIDWNVDLCQITAEQMAEYHAMRITTPWWGDNPEDNLVAQFDITEATPNPFIFVYDEHCKALVEERGAISLVGFGYTVQKVAYDKKVGETVLWEDSPVTIDWNVDLCKLSTELMAAVPVGATIYVYYDMPEAEYHAMRIVVQFDLTEETPNPFEFTYDQHCKDLVDERGAMCLVGFGYRVSKIAFK